MTLYESFSLLLNAGIIVGIAYAIRQININRKQLYLSTITKCIQDYKSLRIYSSLITDIQVIRDYLELTNEELFYFQNKYLRDEVATEWIGGMIDFLPITNPQREIINKKYCIKLLSEKRDSFLIGYPRIKHAFEIKNVYDIDLIYSDDYKFRKERIKERKRIIKELLENVKDFDGFSGK